MTAGTIVLAVFYFLYKGSLYESRGILRKPPCQGNTDLLLEEALKPIAEAGHEIVSSS